MNAVALGSIASNTFITLQTYQKLPGDAAVVCLKGDERGTCLPPF